MSAPVPPQPPGTIAIPSGCVICTTYGPIRHETAMAWAEMRSHSEKNGLQNVRWAAVNGILVEKARNDSVRGMLSDPNSQWLLFVDGDCVMPPDALLNMLRIAYGEMPFVDVLGGYANLRGEIALPTIDTGTGTWESHFPGEGTIEVMRTGAAFLLVKRHVFEQLEDPWFRMRVPARPVDFMREVDNFARIKFDGQNPFRELPARLWERLEQCAVDDPSTRQFVPAEVGEDSGFCDRVKASGFRIFVATDIATGHVDTRTIGWREHKEAMEKMERQNRYPAGLL